MPRKPRYFPEDTPLHITARTSGRTEFAPGLDEAWSILEEQLFFLAHAYNFKIFSFVMMPNHFHMLCSAPSNAVSAGMRTFMTESSRQLNFTAKKENQNWGGPFFSCAIKDYHYFLCAYKYVYRNPVRAGLCSRVERWKYSTLHSLVGKSRSIIPQPEDTILFEDVFKTLRWLNADTSERLDAAIKYQMHSKSFESLKCNRDRVFLRPEQIDLPHHLYV